MDLMELCHGIGLSEEAVNKIDVIRQKNKMYEDMKHLFKNNRDEFYKILMSKNDTELSFHITIANLPVILMKYIKREESRIKFFGILFLIFGFGVMIISARQGSVDLIIMYMTGFGVRWN